MFDIAKLIVRSGKAGGDMVDRPLDARPLPPTVDLRGYELQAGFGGQMKLRRAPQTLLDAQCSCGFKGNSTGR